MPVLQIDNCPADLYAEFAASAAQEQHTAAEQVVILLREWVSQRNARQERRRQRLAKTWERIHQRQVPEAAKNITAEEIKAWINEGRE